MKGTDILGTARDQRRRDELRKLHDGKLLGMLAQGTGLVDQQEVKPNYTMMQSQQQPYTGSSTVKVPADEIKSQPKT